MNFFNDDYDLKEDINEIFIIMSDVDGTLHSMESPTGIGFTTEEKAKKYLKENKIGYRRGYMKIKIID